MCFVQMPKKLSFFGFYLEIFYNESQKILKNDVKSFELYFRR